MVETIVTLAITLAAILAGLAFLLVLWRFIKGPSPFDRIVAFDGLTIVSITGILFAALAEQRGIHLDVALVYALLSFLGVIVVARFLFFSSSPYHPGALQKIDNAFHMDTGERPLPRLPFFLPCRPRRPFRVA